MKYRICFFLCWVLSVFTVKAAGLHDSFPASLLGNWMNVSSQEWEYGFFEDFAIYQSDFWDYKTVKKQGPRTHIELVRDGQKVELTLLEKEGKPLTIIANRGKGQKYELQQKGFLPYHQLDTAVLSEPVLKCDSVIILGYYRNLDKVSADYQGIWGKREVTGAFNDLLGEQQEVKVKIDSLGRFRLKIPVYASQSFYLDWGKLWRNMVVFPGETMMLYLDMLDFEPVGEERMNRELYWKRPKDILFMGEYARLHREMNYCPDYFQMRDMYDLKEITGSDMEYFRAVESDYQDYLKAFAAFHQQYPTLSSLCEQVVTSEAKYRFANVLMQNRFNVRTKDHSGFTDPAYMQYVRQHFSVDSVLYYFVTNRYESFVRDYTGYYDDLEYKYVEGIGMCKTQKDQLVSALKELVAAGSVTDVVQQDLDRYEVLMDSVQQNKYHPIDWHEDSLLFVRMQGFRELPDVLARMKVLKKKEDLLLYDTLIPCRDLREILTVQSFAEDIEHDRVTLSPGLLELLNEKVSSPVIRQPVLELNNRYIQLLNRSIQYPQSLKSSEPFQNVQQFDSLWTALMAPYRGKVVYLDVWGTWCSPCKEMMKYAASLEQQLQGKEVVFMYFAYASPEESWKNVIKEFNLSGENRVHYNLPSQQQKLFLEALNIHSFPTFLLIDRNGKIVNAQAPSPEQATELVTEIEKL